MRFDETTFRDLLAVRPFVPLTLETTGGNEYRISHPENCMIGPAVVALMTNPSHGSVVVLPYEHIASLVANSAPIV